MKLLSSATIVALSLPTFVFGQTPASAPSKTEKTDFRFRVLEMKGTAFQGTAIADPKSTEGWTRLKVGDYLGRGDQLRTNLRSTVKLILEPATPPTIVLVDRATLISIDELVSGQDAGGLDSVITRLGLAYGGIKAGVAEGTVRSDMIIESPVATLAKRGTWGFSFYMERGTGNFEIQLAERGIVDALQHSSGLHITVLPGQAVNQLMSRWVDSVRFNRPVNIQDWKGLKGDELGFLLSNQTGLGVLTPGGDPIAFLNSGGRQNQDFLAQLQGQGGKGLFDLIRGGQSGFNGFGQFGFVNVGDLLNVLPRRVPAGNFSVGGTGLPAFNTKFSNLGSKTVLRSMNQRP